MIFYIAFLALSLFFGFSAWKRVSSGTNTWFDLGIAILLILAGTVLAAQTLTISVVLAEDSIRYGSIFRSHSLRLDQILYRSEYVEYQDGPEGGSNVSYLELIPNHGETQSLKIPKSDFDLDNAFWVWVLRVPDSKDLKPSPLRWD
jgi:hypothetical protein